MRQILHIYRYTKGYQKTTLRKYKIPSIYSTSNRQNMSHPKYYPICIVYMLNIHAKYVLMKTNTIRL